MDAIEESDGKNATERNNEGSRNDAREEKNRWRAQDTEGAYLGKEEWKSRILSGTMDATEESGGKNATERNNEGSRNDAQEEKNARIAQKKEQARRYIGERETDEGER